MRSLPATPYSPHVPPSETGSLSCTAAKTVKEEEALSFMSLHTHKFPHLSPQLMQLCSFKKINLFLSLNTHQTMSAGVKMCCGAALLSLRDPSS